MPSFTHNDIQQTMLLLRNSTNDDDIIAALDILGALQWVDAVPDIMRHIPDAQPDVKAAIEAALLAIGQEAIPAIVEYLPKLKPEYHISLQTLVESFWKNSGAHHIRQMMNHEDNRVRWAMAWTLAKPLKTIPPEDIGYIFDGLGDESLTAIRWAATQSLMTLASSGHNIPSELIQVALPVMVDNFKYGDTNLSESSVQAISMLVNPPHPAINAMLASSDAELQVAAVKVLTAWVQDNKALDETTLAALTSTMKAPSWQMANEVSRLRYVLSISYPEVLEKVEDIPDDRGFDDDLEETQDARATGEIMLPPLKTEEKADDPKETDEVNTVSSTLSENETTDIIDIMDADTEIVEAIPDDKLASADSEDKPTATDNSDKEASLKKDDDDKDSNED